MRKIPIIPASQSCRERTNIYRPIYHLSNVIAYITYLIGQPDLQDGLSPITTLYSRTSTFSNRTLCFRRRSICNTFCSDDGCNSSLEISQHCSPSSSDGDLIRIEDKEVEEVWCVVNDGDPCPSLSNSMFDEVNESSLS